MSSRYESKRGDIMPRTFSKSTARGCTARTASSAQPQPSRASAAPRMRPPAENGWHGGPPASSVALPAHWV